LIGTRFTYGVVLDSITSYVLDHFDSLELDQSRVSEQMLAASKDQTKVTAAIDV